jgi:hypothetical protein
MKNETTVQYVICIIGAHNNQFQEAIVVQGDCSKDLFESVFFDTIHQNPHSPYIVVIFVVVVTVFIIQRWGSCHCQWQFPGK